MDDLTLCTSFGCPLREGCRRAWDGRPTPFKQPWAEFQWRYEEAGAACQFLVPSKEKK